MLNQSFILLVHCQYFLKFSLFKINFVQILMNLITNFFHFIFINSLKID